jgi:hypothetical protein
MAMWKRGIAAGAIVLLAYGTGAAQTPTPELVRTRQQISTMGVVIEQAISHGAESLMAQLSNVMPDRPRLSGRPQVSGVRLQGYGVLFNVQVPGIRLPIMWDLFVQDRQIRDTQNLEVTLQQARTQASTMAPGPVRAQWEQLISQLERQLNAGTVRAGEAGRGSVTAASVIPAGANAGGGVRSEPQPTAVDPSIVNDPMGAYTREVKLALIDAMLENTQPFKLGPDEWFTIVARDGVPTNPLTPGDAIDSSTWVMSVQGSVLAKYHARQITIEEARNLVHVLEQ